MKDYEITIYDDNRTIATYSVENDVEKYMIRINNGLVVCDKKIFILYLKNRNKKIPSRIERGLWNKIKNVFK